MTETTNIYALVDPRNDHVRYVGKASNIASRLYSHITDGRMNHRGRWIKSLKDKGMKPLILSIDIVPEREWQFWEKHYISLYRSWGFDLTNKTDGGDGSSRGCIKKDMKGENNPMYGKKRLDVSKENTLRNGGKTYEEIYGLSKAIEIKEKIGAASKGHKLSAESRAKLSKAHTGKIFSKETRQKMSDSHHLKGKTGAMSPFSKPIIQMDLQGNFIEEYPSLSTAKSLLGIGHGVATAISRGGEIAYGFKWKYK